MDHVGGTRTRGVFSVTLDGEAAGSESWILDRDAVTLQVKSTIAMRLPEPNRQELSLASTASGRFLKLDVVLQLGDGERRASVRLEGGVLKAALYEENAPAYEDEFPAAAFDKVDFGSILTELPLLSSGRVQPGRPCGVSALLLPLPDLRPIAVRQSFEQLGLEVLVLGDGRRLPARRMVKISRLSDGAPLESALWVGEDGLPLRQVVDHAGRTVDISLTFFEERSLGRELPMIDVG